MPQLGDLRKRIDTCDREIIRLLNERMKVCQMIGQAKGRMLAKEMKKDDVKLVNLNNSTKQVYRPVREKLVFDKVGSINASQPGPLTDVAVKAIYREVMSCSINLQQPTTIGYLGPLASTAHVAAVDRFGASMTYVAVDSVKKILKGVESGDLSYGVIPVSNSHAGMESNTLDELANTMMKVYAEIEIPAAFNLLAYVEKEKVKTVYGSQVLLSQCDLWLQKNLQGRDIVVCSSTEDACERCKKNQESSAVVGPALASDQFGIPKTDEHLENLQTISRFFVISQVCEPPSNEDKTFVMFSLRDAQGALFRALAAFKEEGVNLTNIESRPSGSKAW
eukprot:CAMPEP_0114512084 /NCGR_PEP_ID=MMETSP0109-20121206/14769_1 /TAXON_ID=29199 /ORGANISM="Chlorarachnion reptans, Strain CCCM449" /LENGTH=334 /DNA_ID=CAMNT_0001691709 /DNA_START=87 /DNA_END=1088 /DNA_ORIENTATION=-